LHGKSHDAEELEPVLDAMKGDVKFSFLHALKRVIDAPHNESTLIADDLRSVVTKAYDIALKNI
jgi:hypothetical protein